MDRSSTSTPAVTSLVTVLRSRVLPALLLAPLALTLVYLGGWPYFIVCAIVLAAATLEYTRLVEQIGWPLSLPLIQAAVFVQLLAAQQASPVAISLAFLAAIFATMLYILYLFEKVPERPALASGLAMIGAVVLLGWLGGHLIRLRLLPGPAAQYTLLAVLSVWAADVGAFVAGSWFGKRRLAPRISPGKSLEGYLGGVLAGVAGTAVLAILFQLPIAPMLFLGLLIALLAPAGDLSFSLIKREAGVKDSGRLLGGHGGILDRIDSLIWAAAIAYYVFIIL